MTTIYLNTEFSDLDAKYAQQRAHHALAGAKVLRAGGMARSDWS
jgi:hypothetical protein